MHMVAAMECPAPLQRRLRADARPVNDKVHVAAVLLSELAEKRRKPRDIEGSGGLVTVVVAPDERGVETEKLTALLWGVNARGPATGAARRTCRAWPNRPCIRHPVHECGGKHGGIEIEAKHLVHLLCRVPRGRAGRRARGSLQAVRPQDPIHRAGRKPDPPGELRCRVAALEGECHKLGQLLRGNRRRATRAGPIVESVPSGFDKPSPNPADVDRGIASPLGDFSAPRPRPRSRGRPGCGGRGRTTSPVGPAAAPRPRGRLGVRTIGRPCLPTLLT